MLRKNRIPAMIARCCLLAVLSIPILLIAAVWCALEFAFTGKIDDLRSELKTLLRGVRI